MSIPSRNPVEGWWEAAFACHPTPSEQKGHPCGENEMLMLVAYDITDPRRLHKVGKLCEDFGVRVQYSIFECRLEAAHFADFWSQLEALIDPTSDRIVSYRICLSCSREIMTAGTMDLPRKVITYVF